MLAFAPAVEAGEGDVVAAARGVVGNQQIGAEAPQAGLAVGAVRAVGVVGLSVGRGDGVVELADVDAAAGDAGGVASAPGGITLDFEAGAVAGEGDGLFGAAVPAADPIGEGCGFGV